MLNMNDLRKKSIKDLMEDARTLKQEQMNLRFQKAYDQVESPHRIRQVRRDIARIHTVVVEKKREGVSK